MHSSFTHVAFPLYVPSALEKYSPKKKKQKINPEARGEKSLQKNNFKIRKKMKPPEGSISIYQKYTDMERTITI